MKNWLTQGIGLCAIAALSFTSCQKDEDRAVLNPSAAPALSASTNAPALTTTNVNNTAVTYTWTTVNFGYSAAATYTVQFDKKGGNFATPVTFDGGTSGGTLTLTGVQLSKVFTDLGYPTNSPAQVDARVVATVGGGTAPLTSAVSTISATPIPVCVASSDSWGIVGPAGDGWPGATNTDRVLTYDCYSQTYSLTTTLNQGDLKFRANKDWGNNLGGPSGDFTKGVALAPNGDNLQIATAGKYTITLTITKDAAGKLKSGFVTIK